MATFNVERLIRNPKPEDPLFGPFAQGMSRLKGVALEPNQAMIEFYGVAEKDEIDVLASLEEEYKKKLEEFARSGFRTRNRGVSFQTSL